MNYKLNYTPDNPDARDKIQIVDGDITENIFTLKPFAMPVGDQGTIGSCTGWAASAAIYILISRLFNNDKKRVFTPSPLFIYWYGRKESGMEDKDNGAYLRDTMKVLYKIGTCSEYHWPYKEQKWRDKPEVDLNDKKNLYKIKGYERIYRDDNMLETIKKTLSIEKLPVIIGVSLYEKSLAKSRYSGYLDIPSDNDRRTGGHAMTIIGYNEFRNCFIVQNSWSTTFGDDGYLNIPYEYIKDFAHDIWTFDYNYW